jgi:hypothetical protein
MLPALLQLLDCYLIAAKCTVHYAVLTHDKGPEQKYGRTDYTKEAIMCNAVSLLNEKHE